MRSAAELEQWLVAELSARLGIEPRAIDRRERFNRFGLDSMKATALTGRLAEFVGRPLPPTLMWDHPSVDKLVRHLVAPAGAAAPVAPTVSPSATPRPPAAEPIAIVGISCRFPMAPNPEAYWRLLAHSVDAIREVPRDRWSLDTMFDADPAAPGKMSTRWGGFLDQVDRFDAQAFGISPREAAQMDPQQRLALELTAEALDDAGLSVGSLKGSSTGVFIGAMWSDYARLIAGDATSITQYTATGQDTSLITGRVSYYYGLQGPSLTINTACSSALVAVHLACRSLRTGESTLAVAGGVSLVISPESTIAMSKFGAMAPDGRSKAFDARANGYVRGEGGGIVILKPLSRALADGDPVYCVLLGSAMNNDGFSNGLTAPNPQAQEQVLRMAYANAGVNPEQVQYVETHGTGTLLGDPIEAGALGAVLGRGRPGDRPLVIGSVKTNIGHTEAAAGIASLVKVALASRHRQLPPSLHFQTPNPHINFDALRLRVQTALTPWPQLDEPYIAGISSFGFGGTNCHLVVQAFGDSAPQVLPFTAQSDDDVRSLAREFLAQLPAASDPSEQVVAAALQTVHDVRGPVRAAAVFTNGQELRRQLTGLAAGEPQTGVVVGRGDSTGGVVFICSGHGSQWRGMTRSLLHGEPVFRAAFNECSDAIQAVAGWNAVDEVTADPASSRIEQFDLTQPLLFAIQVSLAALWRSWGVEPQAVIGHSMGEVGAACVAGALSIPDAAQVICHRSRLLARMVGQGSIAILGLGRAEVEQRFAEHHDRLWVAACNGPVTTAVSGDPALLQEIVAALQAEKIFARIANADVPAHSPKVEPLRAELFESIRGITARPNAVKIYSTVTGAAIASAQLGPTYWVRNLREPVLFTQAVDAALGDGHDRFVELAPHPVLSTGIEQTLAKAGKKGIVVPSGRRNEDERRVMRESAARLFVSGLSIAWDAVAERALDAPRPVPVVISAHSPAAVRERAVSMAAFVREGGASVLDVAATSARRRTHLEHRASVVARTPSELADRLDAFARTEERAATFAGRAGDTAPRVAFVFCGQGSQWWGMGRELARTFPVFRDTLASCDRLIRRHADWSLLEELGRDESASRIDRLEIAQPAIACLQMALAALWNSWGIRPDVVLGHSMGEVAAAQSAGILTREDAVRVIVQRGRMVQRAAGRGRMAAVELSAADAARVIAPFGDRLSIAAVNGPAAAVLSGEPDAIAEVVRTLEAAGTFARELRVDFASHCAQMDPIAEELTTLLDGIAPSPGTVPILSTVTGDVCEGWEFDATYWGRNTRQPVLFSAAFDRLLARGIDCVIEIGPHPVLAAAMKDCAAVTDGRAPVTLPSLRRDQPEAEVFTGTAGALHTLGYELLWEQVLPAGGRTVALPLYPWQRERHWVGPVRRIVEATSAKGGAVGVASTDINDWVYDVAWEPVAGLNADAPFAGITPTLLHAAVTAVPPSIDRERADATKRLFNRLVDEYIVAALQSAGLSGQARLSPSSLMRQLSALPAHRRLVGRLLDILTLHGLAVRDGEEWDVTLPSAVDPAATCRAIRALGPEYDAELTLLERCGSALAGVLGGDQDPLELLFPDGSPADAERLYQHAPFSRRFNAHIRELVRAALARVPEDRTVRILEVGAGTGATTAHVIEAIGGRRVEYVFSDASSLFLSLARQKFGDRNGMRFELFDVERDPAEQPLTDNTFDLVVAANVLHATSHLTQTLAHVRRMLAPEGLLVLLEGTAPEPWIDLIFGLTSGWWKFDDADLRPAYPLLSAAAWPQLLHAAGFEDTGVWIDPAPESLFEQAVIVCRAPGTPIDKGSAGADWATLTHETLKHPEWMSKALDAGGATRGVIYIAREGQYDSNVSTDDIEASAIESCSDVLRIAQQLTSAGARPPRLWVVTRGAQSVNGGNRVSVVQSPLWGLARALAFEHPQIWGGIIDLDPAEPTPDRADLIALLTAGDEDQLAIRAGTRLAARLVQSAPPESGRLALRSDRTYLVTGGLGSLGLKLARRLVERGARHLVLVGRHAAENNAIRALRALGAEVEVRATDISDAQAVHALIDDLAGRSAPLAGVFHAAGVSVRRPLVSLTRQDFETDFAPKVRGGWLLHQATRERPLDFFVLFSSAAGIWGAQEMGSYAAANHFLDALAHLRHAEGLPALSVNWGRWEEVGVTTADAYEFWDRIGLQPMADTDALDLLENLMTSGVVEKTVGRVEWSRFRALVETKAERPFLHRVGEAPAATLQDSAVAAAPSLAALLEGATTGERLTRITAHVHGEVCSILGVNPIRGIDQERGFAQMGLDSLMAIELRNRLQKALGRPLPSPVIFNYPTVRALGGYLAGVAPDSTASFAPAVSPAGSTPALDSDAVTSLSDEEAEALLALRMAALQEEER